MLKKFLLSNFFVGIFFPLCLFVGIFFPLNLPVCLVSLPFLLVCDLLFVGVFLGFFLGGGSVLFLSFFSWLFVALAGAGFLCLFSSFPFFVFPLLLLVRWCWWCFAQMLQLV